MELNTTNSNATSIKSSGFDFYRMGAGLLFLLIIMVYMSFNDVNQSQGILLVVSAMIGGYMAMNIGANDVANNVGPAVGSQALTLAGAIIIAVIFESAGALIAGGSVVSTIKSGIIDPQLIGDTNTFIWLMMAALLSAALWLNLATYLGAPVSTTHSIVGGVLGAGIAAGGWNIANWSQMGAIASSWVISPVMGGLIAAGFLYLIKHQIIYKKDKLSAAKKVVPLLVMLMTWAFSSYLIVKGIKKIIKVDLPIALMAGFIISAVVYVVVRPMIARAADNLKDSKKSINQLFTVPLIVAAALLSFAHGANDVANAVGPLAAINEALSVSASAAVDGGIVSKASIPLWVMIVGASGIALGLMLYGPKLIKTVGTEITELDKMRAFCIAMAAAITVIIATQFGLPVSSTHIAIGAVFGIGFLRESIKASYDNMVIEIMHHHQDNDPKSVAAVLEEFREASIDEKSVILKQLKKKSSKAKLSKKEIKQLKKHFNRVLVKRSALYKIGAAWVITVPASGLLASLLFFTIRGFMMP